jgi:hypothetical protein
MNVFRGFQFENREAAGAGDAQHVQNAPFAVAAGEELRVNEPRIQRRIHTSDIFSDNRFEPALGLLAIEKTSTPASITFGRVEDRLRRGVEPGDMVFPRRK